MGLRRLTWCIRLVVAVCITTSHRAGSPLHTGSHGGTGLLLGLDQEGKSVGQKVRYGKTQQKKKHACWLVFSPFSFPGPIKCTAPAPPLSWCSFPLKRHLEKDAVGWEYLRSAECFYSVQNTFALVIYWILTITRWYYHFSYVKKFKLRNVKIRGCNIKCAWRSPGNLLNPSLAPAPWFRRPG